MDQMQKASSEKHPMLTLQVEIKKISRTIFKIASIQVFDINSGSIDQNFEEMLLMLISSIAKVSPRWAKKICL